MPFSSPCITFLSPPSLSLFLSLQLKRSIWLLYKSQIENDYFLDSIVVSIHVAPKWKRRKTYVRLEHVGLESKDDVVWNGLSAICNSS